MKDQHIDKNDSLKSEFMLRKYHDEEIKYILFFSNKNFFVYLFIEDSNNISQNWYELHTEEREAAILQI